MLSVSRQMAKIRPTSFITEWDESVNVPRGTAAGVAPQRGRTVRSMMLLNNSAHMRNVENVPRGTIGTDFNF